MDILEIYIFAETLKHKKMKKILLLFIAVCAGFVSCSDDDDDDNRFEGNDKAFIGTLWEHVEIFTDEDDGIEYKEVMTVKFEAGGKYVGGYKEYKKVNGSYVEIPHGDDEQETGTYSVKGNKLILKSSHVDDEGNGTFEATINGTQFSYIETDDDGSSYTYVFKLK